MRLSETQKQRIFTTYYFISGSHPIDAAQADERLDHRCEGPGRGRSPDRVIPIGNAPGGFMAGVDIFWKARRQPSASDYQRTGLRVRSCPPAPVSLLPAHSALLFGIGRHDLTLMLPLGQLPIHTVAAGACLIAKTQSVVLRCKTCDQPSQGRARLAIVPHHSGSGRPGMAMATAIVSLWTSMPT